MSSTKKESTNANQARIQHSILREGALIGCAVIAVILLLTLLSYDPADPGWSRTGSNDQISNAVGPTGAWLSDVFFYIFGQLAYLFPLLVGYQVIKIFREYRIEPASQVSHHLALRVLGFVLIMIAGSALVFFRGSPQSLLPQGDEAACRVGNYEIWITRSAPRNGWMLHRKGLHHV